MPGDSRAARIQVFAQLCVAELIQRALCGAYTGIELVAADFFVGFDLLTPISNLFAPGLPPAAAGSADRCRPAFAPALGSIPALWRSAQTQPEHWHPVLAFRRCELVFLRRCRFLFLLRFFRSFLIGFLFRFFFCREFFGRLVAFLFSFAFRVITSPGFGLATLSAAAGLSPVAAGAAPPSPPSGGTSEHRRRYIKRSNKFM